MGVRNSQCRFESSICCFVWRRRLRGLCVRTQCVASTTIWKPRHIIKCCVHHTFSALLRGKQWDSQLRLYLSCPMRVHDIYTRFVVGRRVKWRYGKANRWPQVQREKESYPQYSEAPAKCNELLALWQYIFVGIVTSVCFVDKSRRLA